MRWFLLDWLRKIHKLRIPRQESSCQFALGLDSEVGFWCEEVKVGISLLVDKYRRKLDVGPSSAFTGGAGKKKRKVVEKRAKCSRRRRAPCTLFYSFRCDENPTKLSPLSTFSPTSFHQTEESDCNFFFQRNSPNIWGTFACTHPVKSLSCCVCIARYQEIL